MTGALAGVVVLLVLALLITGWYAVAARKSVGHDPGQPDQVSQEVSTGLLAERLQRELDGKQ